MKKLLAILILILTLQTPSQADDISDFEIDSGVINISCFAWGKEIKDTKPWRDTLQVSIATNEFIKWMKKEAYK